MVVVQKSVAHPWMCDVLGHMTTRHYVAMFDDAAYHMLYEVFGWTGSSDDENKIAWADVNHTIDYKSEVSEGDILEIEAKLKKIGNKSIVFQHRFFSKKEALVIFKSKFVSVLMDLDTRISIAIPDGIKQQAKVEFPKFFST